MYHLITENIIHRDLEARNVLLTKDLTLKISDFGYSRLVQGSDSGSKTTSTVGPLKWMISILIIFNLTFKLQKALQVKFITKKLMV